MSVNPEDWDVDFAFPNLNLALFWWERSWCRNCNLTEEENSSQITIEDDNELEEIREVFPKKINKRILRHWQQTYLFYKDQRRKDGNDFETHIVSGYQSTPELKRAKTYGAPGFDGINFFNIANLFSLSRRPFVMCYCYIPRLSLN